MTSDPRPVDGEEDAGGAPERRRRGRPRVGSAQDIQRAAVELLATRGYSTMNVDDIAAELGVGRTTLFRYFGSKSGLVWGDYDEGAKRLVALLEASPHSEPFMTSIRNVLLAMMGLSEEDRAFSRARFALISATPELEPDRARMVTRFAESIAAFVRSRVSVAAHPAVPEALGYALAGTLSTVQRSWADSPPGTSSEQMLTSALDAVLGPFGTIFEVPGPR